MKPSAHQFAEQCAVLRAAYAAFNARDIPAARALMAADVAWPRAFKGGFVQGPEAVGAYWNEQWSEIDPHVEALGFHVDDAGGILVAVRQVVRDLQGGLLADEIVGHRFTLLDQKICKMEVEAPLASSVQAQVATRTRMLNVTTKY